MFSGSVPAGVCRSRSLGWKAPSTRSGTGPSCWQHLAQGYIAETEACCWPSSQTVFSSGLTAGPEPREAMHDGGLVLSRAWLPSHKHAGRTGGLKQGGEPLTVSFSVQWDRPQGWRLYQVLSRVLGTSILSSCCISSAETPENSPALVVMAPALQGTLRIPSFCAVMQLLCIAHPDAS